MISVSLFGLHRGSQSHQLNQDCPPLKPRCCVMNGTEVNCGARFLVYVQIGLPVMEKKIQLQVL